MDIACRSRWAANHRQVKEGLRREMKGLPRLSRAAGPGEPPPDADNTVRNDPNF